MLVGHLKVQIILVGLDGVIPGYGKAWVWVRLGMRKCETTLIRAWSMTGGDSRLKRRSEGGKNNVRKIFYALWALFSDDGRIRVLHEALARVKLLWRVWLWFWVGENWDGRWGESGACITCMTTLTIFESARFNSLSVFSNLNVEAQKNNS